MGKSNKSLDLTYTLLYGWLAAWGLMALGFVPRPWIEMVAVIGSFMVLMDVIYFISRYQDKLKETNLKRLSK